MNSQAIAANAAAGGDDALAGIVPIERIRRRWPMVLGGLLSLLMVGGLAHELLDSGLAGLWRVVPSHPLFWLAFALFYLGPPTFDYVIFRKLWGIPAAGLLALHRKRIANDVLIGYSGEAYFYAWARQRTEMVAAPFGAVKDVMILSAIAGNAVTLAMLALALPFAVELLDAQQMRWALGSVAVIIGMSLPFIVFSKRVFSLDRRTLWWVFAIHCLRIISGTLFVAFAWHFAMIEVSFGVWLFLCAARLLVTRLPLVPNKDLLFANFAVLIIGQDAALSELIAFTGALTLLVHVALMAAMGLLVMVRKRW